MNEEDVIKLFLKNGYQLSKRALPLVLSRPEQVIIELGKLTPRPLFVTEEHIQNILKDKMKLKPKIIKEYKKTKEKMKIEDYVNCLSSYYEKIRTIILKRMNKEKLISINKIHPQTSNFSIIGIVRERGDNNIILEDPSGELTVLFENELKQKLVDIRLDDIIGLDCKKTKEKVYAKNVYYPDILSSREINKTETEIKIAILSNLSSLKKEKFQKLITLLTQEEKLSLLFVFSSEETIDSLLKFNPINIPQNAIPQLIEINNIKTLILPKGFFDSSNKITTPMDFLVSILKRRNMLPSFNLLLSSECFVLDEIPDIIISNFNQSVFKNYKGTTIISNSDPSTIYLVNLKTREIEEKGL